MTQDVQRRLDGETLVVRIPMRFQRRGGRKRIVAPDGCEMVPATTRQPDGTQVKALARAWRWQGLLEQGVYTTVSEIGDAENISKSYVSRILRLALLAPDLVDAILGGRIDQGVMLEQLERPLPASWEEQRDHLGWSSGKAGEPAPSPGSERCLLDPASPKVRPLAPQILQLDGER